MQRVLLSVGLSWYQVLMPIGEVTRVFCHISDAKLRMAWQISSPFVFLFLFFWICHALKLFKMFA
jgi:hypothetical protein